jgi:rubrerythrin
MKLVDEFELAKRAILVRLRHMEAYVQTPSPPPTPNTITSTRNSDELNLPERRVTDKDYHYLAQQYRERDSMETLHRSKIEVLRGKQSKALETFAAKKNREMLLLKSEHAKAIKTTEEAQAREEESMNEEFNEKGRRLEARWRLQSQVERTKIERTTGLRYADLPDVLVGSCNGSGHSALTEGRSWCAGW